MTDYIDGVRLSIGTDTYGIYYPYDGKVDIGFLDANHAQDWLDSLAGYPMAEGGYVIRVQIERAEDR